MKSIFILIFLLASFNCFSQVNKMTCVITEPSDNAIVGMGVVHIGVDVKNAKGDVKLVLYCYQNKDDTKSGKKRAEGHSHTFPDSFVWDVTYYEEDVFYRVTATDSEGNVAVSQPIKINVR